MYQCCFDVGLVYIFFLAWWLTTSRALLLLLGSRLLVESFGPAAVSVVPGGLGEQRKEARMGSAWHATTYPKLYSNYPFFSWQHAPGVPKILVGNRLHLAYKRQVSEISAETYALKNDMAFFEVSPLCDFNITESLAELSRLVLKRNGMSRTWGPNRGKIFFQTM